MAIKFFDLFSELSFLSSTNYLSQSSQNSSVL